LKQAISITNNWFSFIQAKATDYSQLFKLKLNLVVVFSAVVGYVLAAGSAFVLVDLLMLVLGGFLITSSANAINEVLEADYDKLMKRTKVRPLPSGRMKSNEAILAAGITGLVATRNWLDCFYWKPNY